MAATPPPMRMSSMPVGHGRVDGLAGQHVADRLLEGRRDVVDVDRGAGALLGLHPAGDGGLEAAEGEVEPVPLHVASGGQPAGEVDGDAVAARGGAVDVRTAREGQPEQAGDLVEGLTGRVVDGGAQRLDAGGHVLDPEQAGVATRDEHRQAGLGQRSVLELVDRDVGGEVVDAVQRLAEAQGQRLGAGDPDQQRAGQAGPAGDRDGVDVAQRDAGGLAGPLDGRAPWPRGAPGSRPRAPPRRSGRARRRCWPPRRRAACARGRCRRRSRRRRSRCRARGVRHSWRHCPRRAADRGEGAAAGPARPTRRGSSAAARRCG